MKNISIYILLLVAIPVLLNGQAEPKYEMRSTWIATVGNIDWPKYEHRGNPDAQKQDLISMLEEYKDANFNSVLLQVRTECDALYQSAYEPWSRYLSWTQGTDPGYDPLQFAIDEGHKRGIEVHAWLNPYRINANASDGGNYYHSTHIYVEHPEWALEYGDGKNILNPGLPEVMSYIGDVIRDLVSKYEIDGVHFDDYFYSYSGTPSNLDASEYAAYGGDMSLSDWRRHNVNSMIDTVNNAIQEINPDIRFGVSPFGVWRNGVPSGISSFDAYSGIYCDPLAWLRSESLDYITPQMYWPTGGSQDFETLVEWWSDTCEHYDRHLFPGMGTYRMPANPGAKKAAEVKDPKLHESKYYFDFPYSNSSISYSPLEQSLKKGTGDPVAEWTLSQIGRQIDIIRANNDQNALGCVFFSAKDLYRVEGLKDYLTLNSFTHAALLPEMTWKTGSVPSAPTSIRIELQESEYKLVWDHTGEINDKFAIYVAQEYASPAEIIADPENLQALTYDHSIFFTELVITDSSRIVVTAISSIGQEGSPSEVIDSLDSYLPFITLESPVDAAIVGVDSLLVWSSDLIDPTYQLQIAKSSSFKNTTYSSAWLSDTIFIIGDADLAGETEYFWRVRSDDGTIGPFIGKRSFYASYPAAPELISPDNLEQQLSRSPRFEWSASAASDFVRIQISSSSSFSSLLADEYFDADLESADLSAVLESSTWYYARLSATNEYGESKNSSFIAFKTSAGELPVVYQLGPDDDATAGSFDLLDWETSTSTGTITYQLEFALDPDFSSKILVTDWIAGDDLEISQLGLEGQRKYYWRVKGKSEFGEGYYSDIWSFIAGYPGRPTITAPVHLSQENYAKLVVGWTADEYTDTVFVELDIYRTWIHSYKERFEVSLNTAQIAVSLAPYTWYFMRISAENEYGSSIFSDDRYFKTDAGTDIENLSIGEDKDFSVWPGIVEDGTFKIRFNRAGLRIDRIDIYDIRGRIFLTDNSSYESDVEIGLSSTLPGNEGIYFVRISYNKGVEVLPFIVGGQK